MSDHETESLIRAWRERFAGRRTVAYAMLEEAELLVRDGIAQGLAAERRERDWAAIRAEGERELAVTRLELKLAQSEKKVQVIAASRDELLKHRTGLAEAHEAAGTEGRTVRILQPKEPGWSKDTGTARPWTLSEVEELAFRLRVAGAVDSTSVRFERGHVEAFVPHPEFALTPAAPPAEVEQVPTPARHGRYWAAGPIVFLLAVLLVGLAALLYGAG